MKRGNKIKIFIVIVLIFLIFLLWVLLNNESNQKNICAKEGEYFSAVYMKEYPEHCCDGLTEWNSGMDTRISIGNECYETMSMSGSPVGTCINCGNGICENLENVCNCPEECDAGDSHYSSIKDFCDDFANSGEGLAKMCKEDPYDLPLCKLCEWK
jgi:hypothetical protein